MNVANSHVVERFCMKLQENAGQAQFCQTDLSFDQYDLLYGFGLVSISSPLRLEILVRSWISSVEVLSALVCSVP